jgi:serine/threonine protein kinase
MFGLRRPGESDMALVPQGARSAPVPSLTPPFVLGQYRVVEKIGRGGMGSVYRALHPLLKKELAVKILPPEATTNGQAVARFRREMEAIGRLDHQNIVRATDAGEVGGIHFLVMELVDGIDLARLVRFCGPPSVAESCELIRQAAVGLQCAHEHDLVHRDVKPSNLVLSRRGEVKVLDLGLALLSRVEPGSPEMTASGQVMGTADYMAPEQWEASHGVDIRADVYSLGCTLYTLLVGRPPFGGEEYATPLKKMAAHAQAPVSLTAVRREDVPEPLQALLARLVAKSPDDRPATPAEVARALEPFARGADLVPLAARALALASPGQPAPPDRPTVLESDRFVTPAPAALQPATPTADPRSMTRRKRRAVGVAAAALLAAAVAVPLGLRHWPGSQPQPDGQTDSGVGKENLRPVERGGWQFLLAKEPGERLWPPAEGARLVHDQKKEVLWFANPSPALIPLGTTDARSYKLEIGFRQERWPGGIGVYLGGQPGTEPGTFTFQWIDLRPAGLNNDQGFNLVRSRGTIRPGPDGKPQVWPASFATAHLTNPLGSKECLLELVVGPNGLTMVRWDGEPCPGLVTDNATAQARAIGEQGEFGIYCHASSGTVLTARFKPTE